MKLTRETAASLVFAAIRQIGEELDNPALANPDEETRLLGEHSGVDSIALVSLIAEIEARIAEETGLELVLADESAMSTLRSPFRRAGVLIDFILTKANEE